MAEPSTLMVFYYTFFPQIVTLSILANCLAALLVVGGVYWIIVKWKYNWTFIERPVHGNRTLVFRDRGKEYIDGEGIPRLKLFWRAKTVPFPPSEAIDVTPRGKKWVEAYKLGPFEYEYIAVKAQTAEGFQPLTTTDKVYLVSEFEKSHLQMNDWLQRNSLTFLAIIAIVCMVGISGALSYYSVKELKYTAHEFKAAADVLAPAVEAATTGRSSRIQTFDATGAST